MTREEARERLRGILTEAVEFENSVCYVTEEDREPLEIAIKALEQEPCEDAISRQAIIDEMEKRHAEGDCITKGFVKNLPPVNPQVKTGHWIYVDECHEHGRCSECGYGSVDLVGGELWNFCPNCGCRMVEPQESEDKE